MLLILNTFDKYQSNTHEGRYFAYLLSVKCIIIIITIPNQEGCRYTYPVSNLYFVRFSAVRLAFSKVRSALSVMFSLHCSLCLPLPRLPSTMLSGISLCMESCLVTCPTKQLSLIYSFKQRSFGTCDTNHLLFDIDININCYNYHYRVRP